MSTRVFKQLGNLAATALGVALLSVLLIPSAKSMDFAKVTTVTIDQPIEVPGRVLGAGTYVFKVDESNTGQQIVQIFDKDERHLYTNTLVWPIYRANVTSDPAFRFEERAQGAPPALHVWFFAGDDRGVEFQYPRVHGITDTSGAAADTH